MPRVRMSRRLQQQNGHESNAIHLFQDFMRLEIAFPGIVLSASVCKHRSNFAVGPFKNAIPWVQGAQKTTVKNYNLPVL